jgi:hypothetical protein
MLRWVIIGVWLMILVVRIVVVSVLPRVDRTVFGTVELSAVVLGVAVVAFGFWRAWVLRLRQFDQTLGVAIRRVDPTVRLVPATPTQELIDAVAAEHSDLELGRRVTWAFGATEASLWQLDDRKAVRVLVVRWSRVMHVGLEDAPGRRGAGSLIAIHYVRPDDSTAVATFAVRRAWGATRTLRSGPRLQQLAAELAAERIVA